MDLSSYVAMKAMSPMIKPFVEWFAAGFGPAHEAKAVLEEAAIVIGRYRDVSGSADVSTFTADATDVALDMVDALLGDDTEPVFSAFHLYIDFLLETGRWSGSNADYHQVHAMLCEDGIEDVPTPALLVPRIPLDEEIQAFEATPLVRHALSLLAWVGRGKAVTATGALRLADIEPAAASVGISAIGTRKRFDEMESLMPGVGEPDELTGSSPTYQVRTMREVPLLNPLWEAMQTSGMLETGVTKVAPARPLGAPGISDQEKLEAYRALLTCFLRIWAGEFETRQILGHELGMLVLSVLAAGASAAPAPVQMLQAMETPPGATAEENILGRAMAKAFNRELLFLMEQGLLTSDTHFRTPRHLNRCLVEGFPGFIEGEYEDAQFPDRDRGQGGNSEAVRPAWKEKPASIYQLKIMLHRSSPPIWRRVLVPSGIQLSELHEIIQSAFGWWDSHMHEFRVGGWNGPSYAPAEYDMSDFGERSRDESRTRLSEVMLAVGEKITYTYDFGDDWEHRIVLEKILEASAAATLPLCTGGRGLAPTDDSGGIWGWAEKVEASTDPEHPEHEETREWLGLSPDEILDPKYFDKNDVNEIFRARAGLLLGHDWLAGPISPPAK
ncbi:plasmid pRiA4b ORF-3 family protein [Paeniglutamicibacter cryotolerans]|uniref:Plasmid pRiA4b Orf3-like domain-containing protein n=1 Tax=Paeniglutamicibacter cryotolerans TaxID=670079 RepID=A0A839QKW1_9MICC|nr:plasmid pRiA4b ORF-3 family protein [Paeniglutamicibacter cryotolerans]MBB2994666.1 hypothetical protein [Paeniglutamicibacter cryotolerans]